MNPSDDLAGLNDQAPGGGAVGGTLGAAGTSNVNPPPPEVEADDTFTAPVVSGRWIWTANPLSGKVALIDATTLRVSTADAGLGPTYVAGLGANSDEDSAAIVLNVGNDTASVLHAKNGVIAVETVKVHHGANRMTVSESGRWALVWSDAALVTNPDPTDGLQDVTVVDLTSSPPAPYPLSVGYRPSRVSIGQGEEHAYFVTEPGISVIDLPAADPPSVARDIAVTADPTEAASVRDVTVTPDGAFALVRRENQSSVNVVSLTGGASVSVTLPGPVTDLDLSPQGDVAYAVVRATAFSATAGELGAGGQAGDTGAGLGGEAGAAGGAPSAGGAPNGAAGAPDGTAGVSEAGSGGTGGAPGLAQSFVASLVLDDIVKDPTAFAALAVSDVVGSIAIAPSGDRAVLFTTATDSDHLVILDTKAFAVVRTVVVQAPVQTVFPAPDGQTAVALLRQSSGSQKAGGFSLVPLVNKLPPKLVGTDAPPQSVAVGEHAALVTVEGKNPTTQANVHAVYLASLPGFGTEKITLASPPLSAALIPDVGQGVVAQSHPEGRITFVDLESGQPRTITGFELSSRVIQDD